MSLALATFAAGILIVWFKLGQIGLRPEIMAVWRARIAAAHPATPPGGIARWRAPQLQPDSYRDDTGSAA